MLKDIQDSLHIVTLNSKGICKTYLSTTHHSYLASTGATFPAFSAAIAASFWSFSARTLRKYLKRRMN